MSDENIVVEPQEVPAEEVVVVVEPEIVVMPEVPVEESFTEV